MAEKAKTAGNKKWAYIAIGIVLLIFANRRSHVQPYIVVLRCGGGEGTPVRAHDVGGGG